MSRTRRRICGRFSTSSSGAAGPSFSTRISSSGRTKTSTLRALGLALKRDPGIFTDRFTRNYITELGGGQIGSGLVEYQRGNIRSEYEPDSSDLYFLSPVGQRPILGQNSVQSKESGEDRPVYLKMQYRERQVIVTLSPHAREGFISPFFADTNYNLYDNRMLSNRLAAWLMGASPSS